MICAANSSSANFRCMSASSQPHEKPPGYVHWPPTERIDRSEAIAHGIILIQQGLTFQAAAKECGASQAAVWRALKRLDDEWAERDDFAWRRATSKGEVVAEMVLDRMMREVERCPNSVLPSWGMFAARIAGWDAVKERAGESADGILGQLLDKLGSRSMTVGVSEREVSRAVSVSISPAESISPIIGTGSPENGTKFPTNSVGNRAIGSEIPDAEIIE